MRKVSVLLLAQFFASTAMGGDRHDIDGVRVGMDFEIAIKAAAAAGALCKIEAIETVRAGPYQVRSSSKATRCTFKNGSLIEFSTPRFVKSSKVVSIDYHFRLSNRQDFQAYKTRFDSNFFGRCATHELPIEGETRNNCILSTADADLLEENAEARRAAVRDASHGPD